MKCRMCTFVTQTLDYNLGQIGDYPCNLYLCCGLTPNMFAPLCLDLAPRRPTVFVAAIVASPSTGTRGIVGGSVAGSQAGTPDTSPTVGRSGIGSRDGAK